MVVTVDDASVRVGDRIVAPKPTGDRPIKIDPLLDELRRRRELARRLGGAFGLPEVRMAQSEPAALFVSVAGTVTYAIGLFRVRTPKGMVALALNVPPGIGGSVVLPRILALRTLVVSVGASTASISWQLGACILRAAPEPISLGDLGAHLGTELSSHASAGVESTPMVIVPTPDATFGSVVAVLAESASLPFERFVSAPLRASAPEPSLPECTSWPANPPEGAPQLDRHWVSFGTCLEACTQRARGDAGPSADPGRCPTLCRADCAQACSDARCREACRGLR